MKLLQVSHQKKKEKNTCHNFLALKFEVTRLDTKSRQILCKEQEYLKQGKSNDLILDN